MRSVRWALLVLLGSCLLQPALSGPHAHNQAVKDRRWKDQLEGLRDYAIVVPQRISASGKHYAPDNHYLPRQKERAASHPQRSQHQHHRRRRSAAAPPSKHDLDRHHSANDSFASESTNHEMFYHIPTRHSINFTLHLVPRRDFISRHVVVQYFDGNTTTLENVSEVVDHGCYHSGYVVEHPGSAALVSLCHGLMGTIRTADDTYFIEPHPDAKNFYDLDQEESQPIPSMETSTNGNAADENYLLSRKKHILYKLSDVQHYAKKTNHCPIKGHHKHERWKPQKSEPRILNTATFSSTSSESLTSSPWQPDSEPTPVDKLSPTDSILESRPWIPQRMSNKYSASSSSHDPVSSSIDSSPKLVSDSEDLDGVNEDSFALTQKLLKSPLSHVNLLKSHLSSKKLRTFSSSSVSSSSLLSKSSSSSSSTFHNSLESPSLPDPESVPQSSSNAPASLSFSYSSQMAASKDNSSQTLSSLALNRQKRSATTRRRPKKSRRKARKSRRNRMSSSGDDGDDIEDLLRLRNERKNHRKRVKKSRGNPRRRQHDDIGSGQRHKRHSRGNAINDATFPPYTGEYVENMEQRFVEVLLVVDQSMYEYHQDDLEHYILTLMAVVRSIYHDPSIGEPIEIVVVKIIVLKDDQNGPSVSGNAIQTLKSFCEWQNRINAPEHDPTHHDTAVLLTRQDLCRSAAKCDTLGLAELGTMCTPRKSCSIIEDNGLSSAFTVAHELGHVFSLPHDEQEACAKYHSPEDKSQMKAMARRLDHTMHPWSWSDCSRGYMNEFIDSGNGGCLVDHPEKEVDMSHVLVAGKEYNADEQCRQIFGDDYAECTYFYPKCRRLWCQSKTQKACITQHMPWADGSKCAPGAWCQGGVCIPERRILPTHGGWSAWTEYSNCTRPCDGGVMVAQRYCNNPKPRHGGKFCTGPKKRYKSCNIQECPAGGTDFRDSQCAAYNGNWYNINGLDHTVKWLPKYAGVADNERCKLMCQANGTAAFYSLNRKVIDGTKCGPTTSDICINGICVKAGCDNILNSTLRRDWCGICGGDNTQCTNISNQYIPDRVSYGYNHVMILPKGAFNVRIVQVSEEEDDNYLVVRTKTGKYLLNGNFSIRLFEKAIVLKDGVQLEYTGSRTTREMLRGTKPLPESLYIEVLAVGALLPPKIYYNYTQYLRPSTQTAAPQRVKHFMWRYERRWSKCSMICDGRKKKSAVCVRIRDLRVVNDNYCRGHKPIPKVKDCQTNCNLRWTKVDQGMCSARCGRGTARVRWRCERQWPRRRRIKYAADKHCQLIAPKPPGQEACRGLCLPVHWEYSWGQCSQSCGGGQQVAQAVCVDDHGSVWKNRECDHVQKDARRSCNNRPCPHWVSSEWSQCDCGTRRQTRHIWCMMDRQTISKRSCDPSQEPSRERDCVSASNCAQWTSGDWGPCYSYHHKCMRSRSVKCRSTDHVFLDNDKCDAESRPSGIEKCPAHRCLTTTRSTSTTTTTTTTTTPRPTTTTTQPTTTRRTTTTPLPTTTTVPPPPTVSRVSEDRTSRRYARWRTGSWTPCSTTCGPGTRERYVSCRDALGRRSHDADCAYAPKPVSMESCVVQTCGTWRMGEWSQCSRTCGEGVASRLVACISLEDLELQRQMPVHCDIDLRPTQEKLCNHGDCVQEKDYSVISISNNNVENTAYWRAGPWGACSKSCEGGTRLRRVVCQDERGDSVDCDPATEPDDQESCNIGPCPSWRTGGWGVCSASCGGGEQRRIVSCLLPNNTALPDHSCDSSRRPESRRDCGMYVCPTAGDLRWAKTEWSQCSVSCGQGHRTRRIVCSDTRGNHYPDRLCAEHKPRQTKLCKQGKCPDWKAYQWSQCSASCGPGLRVRELRCVGSRKQVLNDTQCQHLTIPDNTATCQIRPCTRFFWRPSHWSKCSTSCGPGSSSRRVTCVHMSSRRPVHPRYCPRHQRPRSHHRCLNAPCQQTWHTGEWQQCSSQCGDGRQKREVACHRISPEGWLLQEQVEDCKQSERPVAERLCNYGDCDNMYHWQVSPWSQCSVPCGFGQQRRNVTCIDRMGNSSPPRDCLLLFQPDVFQACYLNHCHASSCAELKKISAVNKDGEYRLSIGNHIRSIYCAKMDGGHPHEFLTLPSSEENHAYIHGKRLQVPSTCPVLDSSENCTDCYREKPFKKAGHTSFSRLRLNITTLSVIGMDFTFSTTRHGRKVPFATAGDCYSTLQKCPQGSFHINLSGTGFRVALNNTWSNAGYRTISSVSIDQGGEVVVGSCGGHCGVCAPKGSSGLQLEIQP